MRIAWAAVILAACGTSAAGTSTGADDGGAGHDASDATATDGGVAIDGAVDSPVDSSLDASRALDLGVGYSPAGLGGDAQPASPDVTAFLTGHAAYGRVVGFYGPWRVPSGPQGATDPLWQFASATRAAPYAVVPILGVGWTDGSGAPDLASAANPDDSWANPDARAAYRKAVTDLATQYQPPYLYLGNEINVWYGDPTHAADWPSWVSEYEACYAAVKQASPGTVVFTVFQLERMKGLGKKNGWSQSPTWPLVKDLAGSLDAIGFTTYPYFEYDAPAEVPADYYAEIAQHFAGPVIFTEVGWTAGAPAPYGGSEADQAAWVQTFFALTSGLAMREATWSFENDPLGLPPAFVADGLRSADGTARAADATWRAAVQARQTP